MMVGQGIRAMAAAAARGRESRKWLAAAGLGAAALLLLGIMLSIQTVSGTVRIELSDPKAQVEVKVDGDVIDIAGLKEPLRLKAGEHGLLVTSGDYQSVSKSFTVRRGQEEILRVTLEPNKPKAVEKPAPIEPPKPRPAVYAVAVDPPQANVSVAGKGASIEGSDAARTITVAEPDGQAKVTVVATLAGYEPLSQELQPKSGELNRLTLRLKASATKPPETTAVAPPPNKSAPDISPLPALKPVPSDKQKETSVDLGNGIKLEMVSIPAGEFMMGSPDADGNAGNYEKPQHRVRITKPFYLGKYLVTQEQWEAVMGSNPSNFKGPNNPVEQVSWDECQQFLNKLNKREGNPGKFQLPSEAQWEYACRAGSTTKFCFGDDEARLGEYAWYAGNSESKTHPVGEKKPNAWGLYDMHGNVWEWCQDWYDGGYYAKSPADDPSGSATGSYRVDRGGSWLDSAGRCRSAIRGGDDPSDRDYDMAFRLALVPSSP